MRIKNTLLGIIATLLLLNLGAVLSPIARALPRAQYRAVRAMRGDPQAAYQQALDEQSAEGWVFVEADGGTLIFKK